MSNFVVSARKYRPALFEEVVGQEHVSQTLKNALRSDHLAHAFLFCGPRGVGKTTCARILAKIINCQNHTANYEACNVCQSCQSFNDNASFNIYELDAASNNSVEDMRALVEQIRFPPQSGKYKVYIIDEVHMLSTSAFNAFLKTLEEPPPYAIFILATTEKHKILPTILSRCQIFDFRRIQVSDIVRHLQHICKEEKIEADEDALHIISQKADGGLRDALSIFDRIVSFTGGRKMTYDDVINNLNVLDYDYYFRVVDALLVEDMPKVMLIFDDILRKGFDADLFVNGLAEHIRNVLMCKDEQTLRLMEVSENLMERYRQQAALAPMAFLLTALNLANDCDIHYKTARNKNLHVEMTLIKMAYIQRAVELAQRPQTVAVEEKKNPDLNVSSPVEAVVEKNTPPPLSIVAEKEPTPIAMGRKSPLTLSSLDDEIAGESVATAATSKPPPPESEIMNAWQNYLNSLDSLMTKSTLARAIVTYSEDKLLFTMPSHNAQGILNNEKNAVSSFLEQAFGQAVSFEVRVDASQFPEEPKPAKPLNGIEKKRVMAETYPMFGELERRFSLRE